MRGTSVVLGNITSVVAKEQVKTTIIRLKILQSLGWDNRKILLVASGRFRENINLIERPVEDGNEKRTEATIAVLYGGVDVLLHQRDLIDNDC